MLSSYIKVLQLLLIDQKKKTDDLRKTILENVLPTNMICMILHLILDCTGNIRLKILTTDWDDKDPQESKTLDKFILNINDKI